MRKMLTRVGFLALLCLAATLAHAATPANFDQGNRLYDSGRYEEARTAYQSLVKSGNYSANLFYNLGNAQYRLGKKGEAFVSYERALWLDPSHPEARANLNLLRDETGARLPGRSWVERAFSWPDDSAGNRPAWLAAAAFWVVCFSLAPMAFRRRPAWLPATLGVLTLAWCGTAFVLGRSGSATWIVKQEASARVAPADSSELAGSLPMGSHVRLLLERGEWLYVALPGQNKEARGWISRSVAEPVALTQGQKQA